MSPNNNNNNKDEHHVIQLNVAVGDAESSFRSKDRNVGLCPARVLTRAVNEETGNTAGCSGCTPVIIPSNQMWADSSRLAVKLVKLLTERGEERRLLTWKTETELQATTKRPENETGNR